MWQLITAMVIWGTLGLFVLKSELGSIEIAFFRSLLGAIILIPYCWFKGYFGEKSFSLKMTCFALLGGIFIVLNWVLLFQSFKLASITLGNVSYYAQPVFLVILGRFFLKEKIPFIKWIFILLTTCGVLMTMGLSTKELNMANGQLLGVLCALAAGLFYSFATLIAKKIQGISPTMLTLLQLCVGTVILFPFIKLQGTQINGSVLFYVLSLGLVHTVAAFILYYQSVKLLPTTSIAVVSYIDPIMAILTDVVFFDRTLGGIQMAGILLTLISSYFVINPKSLRSIRFKKLNEYSPVSEKTL